MKRRIRKELSIGLFCLGIALILKQFTGTPHFIVGALLGLSLCLEIIGALPDKAYNSLKRFKHKTINGTD